MLRTCRPRPAQASCFREVHTRRGETVGPRLLFLNRRRQGIESPLEGGKRKVVNHPPRREKGRGQRRECDGCSIFNITLDQVKGC